MAKKMNAGILSNFTNKFAKTRAQVASDHTAWLSSNTNKVMRFFAPGRRTMDKYAEQRAASELLGEKIDGITGDKTVGDFLNETREATLKQRDDLLDGVRKNIIQGVDSPEAADKAVGILDSLSQVLSSNQMSPDEMRASLVNISSNQLGLQSNEAKRFADGLVSNQERLSEIMNTKSYLDQRAMGGYLSTAGSYLTEGGLSKTVAKAGIASVGIGTLLRAKEGGSMTRDKYGRFDIAGVPFI